MTCFTHMDDKSFIKFLLMTIKIKRKAVEEDFKE